MKHFRPLLFNLLLAASIGSAETLEKGSPSVALSTEFASPVLSEVSGITLINGSLWTINDSNNENAIYRIDKNTGAILQKVIITNARNHDWEEITSNETDIYIGDFGNNDGSRKDLCIYKIPIANLTLNTTEIVADKIRFIYDDQNSFIPDLQHTAFDCEAMVYFNGHLHLFTKGWNNKSTRHYEITASGDFQRAMFVDSFPAGYLVTGASLFSNILYLTGYNLKTMEVVITQFQQAGDNGFLNSTYHRTSCGNLTSVGQVEGIVVNSLHSGYLVSEGIDFVLYDKKAALTTISF